jgi:uncharacterized cupin superfamily protein
VTSLAFSWELQLQEFTPDTFDLLTFGNRNEYSEDAQGQVEFSVVAGGPGRWYSISPCPIEDVEVVVGDNTLTEKFDYLVDYEAGKILFLESGTIAQGVSVLIGATRLGQSRTLLTMGEAPVWSGELELLEWDAHRTEALAIYFIPCILRPTAWGERSIAAFTQFSVVATATGPVIASVRGGPPDQVLVNELSDPLVDHNSEQLLVSGENLASR